jgi:cell division protein FtsB
VKKRKVIYSLLRKNIERLAGRIPRAALKKFLWLASLLFLLVTFFGGDSGFIRIYKLEREKGDLQLRYRELQAEVVGLEQERELLENNPSYLEKIAREKYGLSRPDEKIYRFVPVPPESLPSAP